jgi:TolB-like protein/cytochrome c-type biogenesis protein CcmH/NrfG
MSPEQVSGEQGIDGRSDIYSLACVLYEMLAGDPPFVASNPRAVLAKHMTDPAPPIATVRSDVSKSVAAALTKALGKAPAARFDSAKAFSEALFVTEAKVEEEKKSIVVLPFENLSPDPDNAFLADGLTEELIAALSTVRALRVISRTSATVAKESKKDVPTIARELNVRFVMEGSVRRSGDSLRITAQLVDAMTDGQLWSGKFPGTLDEVFEMQEGVARSIVDALEVHLSTDEQKRMSARPIEDARAYEWYLKANEAVFEFSEQGMTRATGYLERALEQVGPNAQLYAAMAWANWQKVNLGLGQEETIEALDDYVERALSLDPDSSLALAVRGMTEQVFRGNVRESVRVCRRSLALNPDESLALVGLANAYVQFVGMIDAAVQPIERMSEIDPLCFTTHWFQGGRYYFAADFERAADVWSKLHETEPANPAAMLYYALALVSTGRRDAAAEVLRPLTLETSDIAFHRCGRMLAFALQHDADAVHSELTDDFRRTAERDVGFGYMVAQTLAMVEVRQQAFEWLELVESRGFTNHVLLERDPLLKDIRGDERFAELLVRMKRRWEEFEE